MATLRKEWQAIRDEARALQPAALPSRETVTGLWSQLRDEAARQERSVFETSSMMAVSAVKALPDGARWLSASALVGAARTGQIVADGAARALSHDARRHPRGGLCDVRGAAAAARTCARPSVSSRPSASR